MSMMSLLRLPVYSPRLWAGQSSNFTGKVNGSLPLGFTSPMKMCIRDRNKTLLRNTLVLHEKKQAEIKNDTLYVEGKPVQHCHFTKDYYWVGANNAINLSDSRLFGFVPEDHIIGKASIIWFSKEKGTGPFSGYRWGRIWKRVE